MLTSIDDIFVKAKEKSSLSSPKKLVLCQAANAHALEAVLIAARDGIITPILTGDERDDFSLALTKMSSIEVSIMLYFF